MSETVILALIGFVQAVALAVIVVIGQRKQAAATVEVHELVNSRAAKQDSLIAALRAEIATGVRTPVSAGTEQPEA